MEKQPESPKDESNKKYAGKTEDEWRDWGAAFGKHMGAIDQEFGEDMGDWGERFGDYMERRGRRWERKWNRKWERKMGRWHDPFGIVGPLIGTVMSMIILVLAMMILGMVNGSAHSTFIDAVMDFVYTYLYVFFLSSLFFGYARYFTRHYPGSGWIMRPITGAAGITFFAWIMGFILTKINVMSANPTMLALGEFLDQNLLGIFVVFMMIGYAFSVFAWFVTGGWGD